MPGAAGITKMMVTKATSAMPSPVLAGDNRLQLNGRGLTWEPVMSMCMRARMATTRMRMSRKKYCKLMMDHRRMWRTEGIVGLTWEPVMLTEMMARMATLRLRMRWKIHRTPMMYQRRMWKTEGIVLESGKIRQYISDL